MILTFDCYGTLLDMHPVDAAIADLAREVNCDAQLAISTYANMEDRLMYGTPITPYLALIRQNLAYCDMILGTGTHFSSGYAQIVAAYQALRPYPEVNSALRALKADGVTLVIMSNSTTNLMHYHQAVLAPVDEVITADETRCYKPTREFFEQVAARLPAGPHLHVAHGFWWDMVPARQLGWQRLWINRDQLVPLAEEQPLAELPDLGKLPAYVHQYEKTF